MIAQGVYRIFDDGARASFGGDEFLFVELSEAMSLSGALRIQGMMRALEERGIPGLIDVCPSNASYMLRYAPEVIAPQHLLEELEGLHADYPDAQRIRLETEIIRIPVLYDDPWTRETLLRFRDRHQSASETDIEYCARINGFDSVADFVTAHSSRPFLVTFPCFVPGNAECVQLVPEERQLQAPKYVSPRTATPARALGHGGAFSTVYPAFGAGGYQLIGRAAVPVVDMTASLPRFRDSVVLARPATILAFTPIDREEYFSIRDRVRAGSYHYESAPVSFDLQQYLADPDSYARALMKELP